MVIRAGYKKTEVGFIPEEWKAIKLKDISTMKSGKSITSRAIDKYGEYPCYGGNGLRGYTNDYTHNGKYALIGRQGALCGNVVFVNGKFFASEHAVVVSPNDGYDIKWLSFVLKDMGLNRYSESSAQPGLSVLKIGELQVACPSAITEQQAIATALSDIDNLINSLTKLINKKKSTKQGAMQELLAGKRRLEGFGGEWAETTLGKVCDIGRGGSPRPIQKYITDSADGVNWIKIGDVKASAKYINSTKEKIVPTGKAYSREVKVGDLILSNSMSFGRPYILNVDGCIHDGWLVIQNYHGTFSLDFLYYYLSSDVTFKQYISMAAGSSVQNLNKAKVAGVIVPIIEKEEQIAIANILSDMDKEIQLVELELMKLKAIKQGMMQELLTGRIRLLEEVAQ